MITSWTQFLAEILRLIDGEDTSPSAIPVATLTRCVNMGERRIYRQLRCRYNEKAFSGVTVTGNLATLPADFIEASIVHFGNGPLLPWTEEVGAEALARTTAGAPQYFARAGNSLQFWPAVADGTAVQGRYYYRLPELDASTLPTNPVFAVAEDLFTYAALAESAPFFGQSANIGTWESRYDAILNDLNRVDQRTAYGAGRMRRRPSVTVLR